MADAASSISVCVRVRPFTIKEAAQLTHTPDSPLFLGDGSLAGAPAPKLTQKGLRSVIKVVDEKCLIFDPPEDNPVHKFSRSVVPQGKRVKDQTFGFDRIFDDNAAQADVYEGTTRGLLDSVLDGYNATVFAYGATGCGKTHTITGTMQAPGIIFLTMQELFERIGDRAEDKVAEISLSYLEIYNETIRDLLVPGGGKGGLMLREDANQAVSVAGLSSHHPQNVQEVMDMIVRGNEYRTMSPTEANATSSRSHAVLQINVSQRDRNADIHEPHTMATLSIIDLAGSERASATKNRGERLLEGANINKSLLALGSCINALCDPRKKNHVPYRNSKLTRLLKFSLGGNCKTVMIVCVSPSSAHFDETQNTLRYANRAKNIQTKVTRNVFNVNRHVKDFLVKIDEQMALINELKAQQKDSEATAFAKFRKQSEKRETVAREAIARMRTAFENSASDRTDRLNCSRKLKQIERRIALLSGWIAAFDRVAEAQNDASLLSCLDAMRKTGQGMLLEWERSRHHYHSKLSKSNWARPVETALQNGLRQLRDCDTQAVGQESSNLEREAELLRGTAERELYTAMAEEDKAADAGTIETLLQAHFETIAAVQSLIGRDEAEAVRLARGILDRILKSSTAVTSHIVRPDERLLPVQAFPPSKTGTPKRKKQSFLVTSSPHVSRLSIGLSAAPQLDMSPARGSPMRMSPKRRKFGAAKKGVSFTPKKKSPSKSKRAVRWRDDADEGALAEFQRTPKKVEVTPEATPKTADINEAAHPTPSETTEVEPAPPSITTSLPQSSSPIPTPPEASTDVKNTTDRFKAGFLSKKSAASPPVPTITALSSDSDQSPLRDLHPTTAGNRSALSQVQASNDGLQKGHGGSSSGSENEDRRDHSKSESARVRAAIKRTSIVPGSAPGSMRTQRRRSPTSATRSDSPPHDGQGLFTASHARRMVHSERERDWQASVLSPRTVSITKAGGRRTTMSGDTRAKDSSAAGAGGWNRDAGVRLSVIAAGGSNGARGSLMPGKAVWR